MADIPTAIVPAYRKANMEKARMTRLRRLAEEKEKLLTDLEIRAAQPVPTSPTQEDQQDSDPGLLEVIRMVARQEAIEVCKQSQNSGWLTLAASGLSLAGSFLPSILAKRSEKKMTEPPMAPDALVDWAS